MSETHALVTEPAEVATGLAAEEVHDEETSAAESLIEEVSIDGMCGVY
ncbi:mycofactocin precursor MftA [Actinomadura scrupuli]